MTGGFVLEQSGDRETLAVAWLPSVAGVLGAAGVGWWACFHSMRSMSPVLLFALAAAYVVAAALACGAVFAIVHGLVSGRAPACLRHSLVSSVLAAAWLPPLALAVDLHSPWMLIPVPVIAVVWVLAARSHADAVFGSDPKASGSRRTAFAVSLMVQSSLALAIVNKPMWALPLLSIASALMAAGWYATEPRPVRPCRSLRGCARRASALTAAAVAVTAAALLPHLARWSVQASGTGDEVPTSMPQARTRSAPADDADDIHTGVIIWPEIQPDVTLVPPMPSLAPGFGKTRADHPLSISFFGAYWIYRPPDKQPPPSSLVIRGSPLDRRLRSMDRVSLKMEARQNFGAFFDTRCCRSIGLVVVSGDRYFGTVTLELLLGDSSTGKNQLLSLGSAAVLSSRHHSQALSFAIPADGGLRRFDEAVVVFHLDPIRADKAAQVQIRRFVFIPR